MSNVTVETYRDSMMCDRIIVVYGPFVGSRRKILKIDREWSTNRDWRLSGEDLEMLYEYLAEERERFDDPPTIALDHAHQTIAYLKETI